MNFPWEMRGFSITVRLRIVFATVIVLMLLRQLSKLLAFSKRQSADEPDHARGTPPDHRFAAQQ